MANPGKSHDPAAAALSAIEEALNLADLTEENPPSRPAGKPEVRASEVRAPDARRVEPRPDDRLTANPLLKTPAAQSSRDRNARPKLPDIDDNALFAPRRKPAGGQPGEDKPVVTPSSRPANDDRESVGQILRAMQVKPSGTPMVVAGLASIAWILVCVLYLYADRANLAEGSLLQPRTALVLLAIVGPLLFFFMTAALTRRAQEVRMTARSMMQVAVRLAEPETIATEQMVTLSQAIRREIASMGDGIERALARAGELETLVRSEVSNLERSYADNERRVRSLIDELSSERAAILVNADKVRGAIAGAHESFARDLEARRWRPPRRHRSPP